MDILLISDLHTEHLDEYEGRRIINSFPKANVIVLAGDICDIKNAPFVLNMFCDRYENVIYVCGNHEYYRSSFKQMDECIAGIKNNNFHWLEQKRKSIKGHNFIGATMWYPYTYHAEIHKDDFSDFTSIKNYNEIFLRYEQTKSYFKKNVQRNDIVVTHHLPTFLSVAPQYKGSVANSFFVAPMDEMIIEKQPKIWMHGHTHQSCDYHIDSTRVICNPLGYKHKVNPTFKHLILQVY